MNVAPPYHDNYPKRKRANREEYLELEGSIAGQEFAGKHTVGDKKRNKKK